MAERSGRQMLFRLGEFEIQSLEPSFIKSLIRSPEKFSSCGDGFVHLVTFNSLMYLDALRYPEFARALKEADLLLAESAGIRWACGFLYNLDIEVLPGIDLVQGLFDSSRESEKPVSFYFFGGKPGVAERAAKNVLKRWPWVRVSGVSDGFGGLRDAGEAAPIIGAADADVLLAGLGSPRQELFIWRNRAELSKRFRVAVGVGGALDVLSGDLSRAPRQMRSLGLEWFWRVVQEPRRLPRIARLAGFVAEVLKLKRQLKGQQPGKT